MRFRSPATLRIAVTTTVGVLLLAYASLMSHEKVKTSVTYDREVSRILVRRCINCHAPGSLAVPFTTYEETRPWARAIEEDVLSRHMPPWRAVPGYGAFANDGGLTLREQQTLLAWIEGNGPKTPEQLLIVNLDQGRTRPEEHLKPDFDRWQLGEPQLRRVIMADGAPLSTAGGLRMVRTSVSLATDADKYVRALELRPSDRGALRAARFTLESTGQWLGGWTPWHAGVALPPDVGYRLPRGARVAVDLFYQSGSLPGENVGQIGVSFTDGTPSWCGAEIALQASGDVLPQTPRTKFEARTTLVADVSVLALAPELREGARTLEVTARATDGSVQVLLFVRDILDDWPTPYILASPLALTRGTELSVTTYYENSTNAPREGGVDLRVATASICQAPRA